MRHGRVAKWDARRRPILGDVTMSGRDNAQLRESARKTDSAQGRPMIGTLPAQVLRIQRAANIGRPTRRRHMTDKKTNKWIDEASKLEAAEIRPPAVPVAVVLAEAMQAAQFVEKYWRATRERPGLEATAEFMPKSIAGDITSLVDACQTAHADGIFVESNDDNSKVAARARRVAGELAAGLEFVLDDGKTTPSDAALAVVKLREASAGTVAQLTQSLIDFATLAKREEKSLARVAGYDIGLIAEAKKLANELLPSATGPGRVASDAIRQRDRLLVLLGRKVSEVRRTARFVFRNHPEIQKLATSRYERRRRVERKANGKGKNDSDTTTAATGPTA